MRRIVGGLVVVAALAGLWIGYPWLVAPQTYHLSVVYLATVVAAGGLHLVALYRFHKMYLTIRAAERSANARPGSTLFAGNQRFRYAVRVTESLWVAVLGAILLLEVNNPQLATRRFVGWIIIVYFIGSIAVTGYLTYRDLHVVNVLRATDVEHRRVAELRPFEET